MDMMTDRIGIAGYRSFISQALERRLSRAPLRKTVFPLCKGSLGVDDLSEFDCVYLVLGRARPTPEEESAEREQLLSFLENPRHPRRAVYLSSMRLTDSKLQCEDAIRHWRGTPPRTGDMRVHALRPAAVFGPQQDIGSHMLVPSIVRHAEEFVPSYPDRLTKFISVDDLAGHLARFSDLDWSDMNGCGEPGSIFEIPGTFTATPHQVQELYLAFRGLEAARQRALRARSAAGRG